MTTQTQHQITPRAYQRLGTEWLRKTTRGILADEQGLGKTLQVINALPDDGNAVICCPPSTGLSWVAHLIQRWDEGSVLYPNKTAANKAKRMLPDGWRAVVPADLPYVPRPLVMFYPQLLNNRVFSTIRSCDIDVAVFDEAHRLKSRTSRTHDRARVISGAARRCWGMTGTPISISAYEVPCILRGLGILGERKEFYQHLQEYFRAVPTRWKSVDYKPINLIKYARDLGKQGIMLRRKKAQVADDLPPKTPLDVFVDTDPKITRKAVQAYLDENPDVQVHKGVLTEIERRVNGVQKAERLDEVLATAVGRVGKLGKTIFWAHHRDVLDKAQETFVAQFPECQYARLDGSVPQTERQRVIKEFQGGKYHALFCSIRAVGEGVTLTPAHTAVFLQRDWNPALNLQAEDRIHRLTQENPVSIIRVWGENCPLEVRIQRVLTLRKWVSEKVLSEMRQVREAELIGGLV